MEIKPWTIPGDIKDAIRFKATEHTLTVQFYDKKQREAQITLTYGSIDNLLSTDLQSEDNDNLCNACKTETTNYIQVELNDTEPYEEHFPIHPYCYNTYTRIINQIQTKYSSEILSETI